MTAVTTPTASAAIACSGIARRQQGGFSLIEMLVALMVVVMLISVAAFTVNSGGQDIRLEATVRNLADVARYALDEAQLTGVDYGLLLEEQPGPNGDLQYSYSWFERHIDGWAEPTKRAQDDEVFTAQQLPPGIGLRLELEDAPLVSLSLEKDEEDTQLAPQVVLYASGETSVGAIDIERRADGELLWRIEWDLLGRFKVLPGGEEPQEG